jgi:hypothetical protein
VSLRVVLLAEGSGETLGEGPFGRPAPGEPIRGEEQGAGHILVARALEVARRLPAAAIQFQTPPRVRGRDARGSDLLYRDTLRRLLTWPRPQDRPDLAVVLVDQDGQPGRAALLAGHLAGLPASHVVVVAIQEFEAWLVADQGALRAVFGPEAVAPPVPEALEPRLAKGLIRAWTSAHGRGQEARRLRCDLAHVCDLEVLQAVCPAFRRFVKDLDTFER